MTKKVTEPRVNTTVRLPESIHGKLVEIAKSASRSINQQIAHWVKNAGIVAICVLAASCSPDPKPTTMTCAQISAELESLDNGWSIISKEEHDKRMARAAYLRSIDCND